MQQDQGRWWDVMGRLQRMLRRAARLLHVAGVLSTDQMHNYFMSGLSSLRT